jgi:hypothetical protein
MDISTQTWLEQEDAYVSTTIRKHGWCIQYVGGDSCSRPGCECGPDDGPPFAYTIGLFGLGHPELLILGARRPRPDACSTHSATGSGREPTSSTAS